MQPPIIKTLFSTSIFLIFTAHLSHAFNRVDILHHFTTKEYLSPATTRQLNDITYYDFQLSSQFSVPQDSSADVRIWLIFVSFAHFSPPQIERETYTVHVGCFCSSKWSPWQVLGHALYTLYRKNTKYTYRNKSKGKRLGNTCPFRK